MKKILLLAFLLLCLCACKKDEEPDYFDPRIIGHWEGSYTKPSFLDGHIITFNLTLNVNPDLTAYFRITDDDPGSKIREEKGFVEFRDNKQFILLREDRKSGSIYNYEFINGKTLMLGSTRMDKH